MLQDPRRSKELLEPIIQSIYLWSFRNNKIREQKAKINFALQLLNFGFCIISILAVKAGWLGIFGERFLVLGESSIIWLAAAFSVSSTCVLFFYVFPSGNFVLFRRATLAQLLGFAITGAWLAYEVNETCTWLLFWGEFALLTAILIQLFLRGILAKKNIRLGTNQ
jgi:hypothetical protein